MTTHSGTLVGVAKRKRREPKPDPPPRPTVADVDGWLAQIDQVLEEAPSAEQKGHDNG
jgi:hypothetical protein